MAAFTFDERCEALPVVPPNLAVNTDAHRRGVARAVVAGYLARRAAHGPTSLR
jgi:hypothetical protein